VVAKKVVKWKLIPDAKLQGSSDDYFYGITNGYIVLKKVLTDKNQIKQVKDAVGVLENFFQALKTANLKSKF